jgi:hypothetical protein
VVYARKNEPILYIRQLYLRELPEPLFRFNQQDRIQHSDHLGIFKDLPPALARISFSAAEHQNNNFMLLRSKLRRLPLIHQATFKALVEHLTRVVSRSERNKMDAKNLAIIFGVVIFGDDELPKGGDLLNVQISKVRFLILYAFTDRSKISRIPCSRI